MSLKFKFPMYWLSLDPLGLSGLYLSASLKCSLILLFGFWKRELKRTARETDEMMMIDPLELKL